ncbi:DUF4124 domain-containing protein [Vreelandella olivaria]|uniref:DUF4124 domain-containing protein n=1 Tax=Vreelandella olivaria TaxID=390919 RepID=UPI00201E8D44|nr:DUF4124 domain-containing protein [Halomonas olivaria]
MSRWVAGMLVLSAWWHIAQAQTVYRVVDAQGKVTFTDNPERGGEAVQLAPLPSMAPRTEAPLWPPQARPGQPFMPYDRFVISTPQAGTSLPDGMTAVELHVSPPLREDHQVQLLVNGEVSQSALHSDVFWLTGLSEGYHQLQAELLDSSGRVQHRTQPVSIIVAEN